MAFEGDLARASLAKVLQRLAYQQETGILTVQGQNDIVAISFLEGQIVAADALNQTIEEGLGKILTEQELVSAEDWKAVAREHQGGSSGSLGELLVERQLLTREQLLAALRAQTYRLMLQVLRWDQGEYKFYSGDEVSYESGFKSIPIEELIVRSLRDIGHELPDPKRVYKRLEPEAEIRVFGREGDGTGAGIWLTQAEVTFLEKVDGERATSTIARECGLGKYRALYCLHRLLEEKLIEGLPRDDAEEEETTPPPKTPPPKTPLREPVLQAPIFTPPDEIAPPSASPKPAPSAPVVPPAAPAPKAPAPSPEPAVTPRAVPAPGRVAVGPRLGGLLALVMALALGGALWMRPIEMHSPFPWQSQDRAALEHQMRQTLTLKIDRAARTWFLLEADYPDALEELVATGLISSADLRDPVGHRLRYEKEVLRYTLVPLEEGEPIESLARSESIADDFFLDPQFFPKADSSEPAVYLID